MEAFKAKGIEVLLLTDPIDEFWTQTLPNYKGFAIQHIANADIDLNIERKDDKAGDGEMEKLCSIMNELFKNEVGKVTTTEKLTNSPVSLNVEQGQMSIHLEPLLRKEFMKILLIEKKLQLCHVSYQLKI